MTTPTPNTPVVVTGAASGIGKACARALAETGRPVALWDIDEQRCQQAAEEISQETGTLCCHYAFDISDIGQLSATTAHARETLGAIGGLVHAAGISHAANVDDLTPDDWDKVLDVNLRPYPFLVKALLADFRLNPMSAVVGIGSINAILGNGLIPAYSASKAGLLATTRSLAAALGPEGIRVNAICPGYIRTPMSIQALEQNPEFEETFRSQTFLQRMGEPEEIAAVARFLLSKDASYITGQSIIVDAGAVISQL